MGKKEVKPPPFDPSIQPPDEVQAKLEPPDAKLYETFVPPISGEPTATPPPKPSIRRGDPILLEKPVALKVNQPKLL